MGFYSKMISLKIGWCFHYFSVAVIERQAEVAYGRRNLFWLTAPEGHKSIMEGRHGGSNRMSEAERAS